MKKIFNAVAPVGRVLFGNGRYIHYDGSAFGSKGVARYMQQPEIKAGLYASVVVGAVNLFLNDPNTATASFLNNLMLIAPAILVKSLYEHMLFKNVKKDVAIDTEGRDLSPQSVRLNDMYDLIRNRRNSIMSPVLLSAFYAADNIMGGYSANRIAGDVVLYSFFAKQFWNSSKLLSGDYIYCDKQPPEKKKFSLANLLPAGKTAPS